MSSVSWRRTSRLAAKLIASWVAPSEAAPSPNQHMATEPAPCTTDGDCAVPGGTCAAKGLYQMSLRYRLIENVPYLTFRVKAYGDLSLATESCMTTQFTTGDAAGALQADWTKRKSRAWLLRVGDYSCDAPGCASQMP